MKICAHIDQINKQKWQLLLDNSPFSSPFQTPAFFDVFNSLETSSAEVFAVEDKGQYLALVVVTVQEERGLKASLTRRAVVYGGVVLLDEEQKEAMMLLLSHLKDFYKRKLIYLEIRNSFDYKAYKSTARNSGFSYVAWLNYKFKNISPPSFREGMKKPRLRQLKKGLRNGSTWREANAIEDIKAFYSILSDLYIQKVKKPLPAFQLFEQLFLSGLAVCLVVEKDNAIIGGVMCPVYASKALYEFYICGKDKQYPDAHPSIIAMWAMVEYTDKKGIKEIDLMGAGPVGKPSSVRNFKSKFGAELVEHGRFVFKYKPLLYAVGRYYLKVKAKL